MQSEHPRYSSLLPLGLLNFFIYGTMVIFAAFFQIYLQEIGMNKIEIGSLLALGPLISLVANPFWRHSNDRLHNIRNMLLLIMLGILIMGNLVFQVNTYNMMYVAVILLYFFQSPLLSQSNSLILGHIEGTKHNFNSFRLWGSIGWAVIAVAAGPIIDHSGPYGISILFSVTLLLAISSAAMLKPLARAQHTPWVTFRDYKTVLLNKYFMGFILLGILVAIPNAMNGIFMPLFITDLGGSKLDVGLAIFLSTIFEIGAFRLLDRYLPKKMSALMGCLTCVSLLFALRWYLMSELTTPLEIILTQIMHSVTFGGFFYVGIQLTALFLPRPLRSSGQAVYALFWSGISGLIAGLLGGFLFQDYGSMVLYKFAVAMTLCGAVGFGIMWYEIHKNGYSPADFHK